ncbi:hypothetical protein YC2023_106582 [Brassica napus]
MREEPIGADWVLMTVLTELKACLLLMNVRSLFGEGISMLLFLDLGIYQTCFLSDNIDQKLTLSLNPEVKNSRFTMKINRKEESFHYNGTSKDLFPLR